MEIRYDVTGEKRKALVKTISQVIGAEVQFQGVPSLAYRIGPFTVTRDGTLIPEDDIEQTIIEKVLTAIREAGYTTEQEVRELAERESRGTIIQVPREGFTEEAIERLRMLIRAKACLLSKVVGKETLDVEVGDAMLTFSWFKLRPSPEEMHAYVSLVTGLCDLAKDAKRVTAKEKEYENEKYAFRCFLLRLGFIGDKYKEDRKILLSNLSGSAAFRNGGNHVSE